VGAVGVMGVMGVMGGIKIYLEIIC
jgi:hypothetical protein